METVTLDAPDISCGHCVATVEQAVGKVDGVQAVCADAGSKDVNVTYDASQTDAVRHHGSARRSGIPGEVVARQAVIHAQAAGRHAINTYRPACRHEARLVRSQAPMQRVPCPGNRDTSLQNCVPYGEYHRASNPGRPTRSPRR